MARNEALIRLGRMCMGYPEIGSRYNIISPNLWHQLVDAGKPVQTRANVHAESLLSGDWVEHVLPWLHRCLRHIAPEVRLAGIP